MFISYIIPAYNAEKYILDCLTSIKNQTGKKEIIVINDGSTDSTREIIDSFEGVIAFHGQNRGVSASRNIGLKHAKGDWIVFVDADDRLSHDFQDYMKSLVSNKSVDFAYSQNCFRSATEKQISNDELLFKNSIEAIEDFLSPTVVVGCWNKIYRKSFLLENHLRFEESLRYGEGLKFIVECATKANMIICGKRKIYYYRTDNVNSATTKFDSEKILEGDVALSYIEKQLKADKENKMFLYHRLLYRIFSLVRSNISVENKLSKEVYQKWLSYCRNNVLKVTNYNRIGLFRRFMLVLGSLSPWIVAPFEILRRFYKIKKTIN